MVNLPSGLDDLPDSALIPSREVFRLAGYDSLEALNSAVRRGLFPQPDFVTKTAKGRRHHWTIKTLKGVDR